MATKRQKEQTGDNPSIEATLLKLEQILQRMESEEQPLEASLADFEEGISLTRQAQTMLREAEQKVQLLTESSTGEPQASALIPAEDGDSER
ncbi:exodeoxyribonuclease VII small subunit [Chromatocurvus halotolerans]|uniref:Exodeoxyribonuclease 7 small subunit n=1 Tax=Chromatocurvus halotolerans TaxID=1132028 RepID=A0A4R2KDP5_9GAMM|nr:exodeoxyribonuclease VII small subunit [Chromatocurvus halotolerans]TCO70442.1 exodeoxyribonuclease VII small subunit [Chromatocurvus halotolerans]